MTRAEILNCLTDRPCDSCKFHESGRCERWNCVFEEEPDDAEADAISRISVLDTLDNTDEFMDEDRTVETYKALLKECYKTLSPVTPKQKVGRWIFDDKCKEHGHCSLCGYGSVDLMDGEPHDFCRRCGAKMVESEDTE